MKSIPNITSVRFFLAMLVVIQHVSSFCMNRGFFYYDDLAVFHKGKEAVYMFFCLSGFLIIRQLYIEKEETNTISLKNFYLRRILRIFPLYYLVLTIGLVYYQVVLPALGFEFENNYNLLKGIILGGTFFANIFLTYNPGGIIEILWSIAIEEQFYLFIAPLILLIPRNKMLLSLLLFTIVYFLLFHNFQTLRQYQMYYYYFSLSGFFSIMVYKYNIMSKIPRLIKNALLVVVLLYFTTRIFTGFTFVGYQLTSLLLLPIGICVLSERAFRILENKSLKYLGKISYGIYMYHAIVMQLVGLLFLKISFLSTLPAIPFILSFNLLVIIITLIVSHLSYKYFESYFLSLKKTFRKKGN